MQQLTIRGFDPELERRLKNLARDEQISLNRAALKLLRRGAGLLDAPSKGRVIGHALDDFMGDWSEEEEREFLAAVEPMEQIDEEMWK